MYIADMTGVLPMLGIYYGFIYIADTIYCRYDRRVTHVRYILQIL